MVIRRLGRDDGSAGRVFSIFALNGAIIIGVMSLYSLAYIDYSQRAERTRVQSGLEVKAGDYNGNNLSDKFYEIDGNKVPVEVDGKPVIEYFRE